MTRHTNLAFYTNPVLRPAPRARFLRLQVTAFAGTGKTTTAVEFVRAHPSLSMLYLTFNKRLAEDAVARLEARELRHCEARTISSLVCPQQRDPLSTVIDNLFFSMILHFLKSSDGIYAKFHPLLYQIGPLWICKRICGFGSHF